MVLIVRMIDPIVNSSPAVSTTMATAPMAATPSPVIFAPVVFPSHPLADLPLLTVLRRLVIDAPGDLRRTVFLGHPTPGIVVRILVAHTVTQLAGRAVGGVPQVGRNGARGPGPDVLAGRPQRLGHAVGLG